MHKQQAKLDQLKAEVKALQQLLEPQDADEVIRTHDELVRLVSRSLNIPIIAHSGSRCACAGSATQGASNASSTGQTETDCGGADRKQR